MPPRKRMGKGPAERRSTRQRSLEMNGKKKEDECRNEEMRLLETGNFSDVIVHCGERTFNLHKFVLCTRSKFFKAALTGFFEEAGSGIVTLVETNPEIFAAVVEYLYREEIPNLNLLQAQVNIVGVLTQLYLAGQYFAVEGLENDIVSYLTTDYYCSLKFSADGKAMPTPAGKNQDGEWLAHFFGAIDMAFEAGIVKGDPLQEFFTNLVHRSFDWCFESRDFMRLLETRGFFAMAITADVVNHINDLGLKPLTSLGGPECKGLTCGNCQTNLEDESAVLLGMPSAECRLEGHRSQYVCLPCKSKRGVFQF